MVSIVLPTYNRGSVIKRSIQSVLNQSYRDYELIIVDDGSIDDTEEVVNGFCDDRIIYKKLQRNHGACYARNQRMSISRGSIIAFIDSDNEWLPGYLLAQVECFNDECVDISFYKVERIYADESTKVFPELEGTINTDILYRKMLIANVMDTNVTCIRKKCYLDFGGFDESFPRYQDWDFFLVLIERGAKVKFHDCVMAMCHIMKDSISLRDDYKEIGFIMLLRKHCGYMKKRKCLDKSILFLLKLAELQKTEERYRYNIYNNFNDFVFSETELKKYKKISLYGFGNNGKILYELLHINKTVVSVVDKFCDLNPAIDVPFLRSVSDVKEADCIVVTIDKDVEEIVKEIRCQTNIPVFSFSDLMNG